MEITNAKGINMSELTDKLKVKETTNVTLKGSEFNASELTVSKLTIRNRNTSAFGNAELDAGQSSIQLSLSSQGLLLPAKLATLVHESILSTYFQGKQCRFLTGKLKCKEKLSMNNLFESMMDLRFDNNFTLSLPLQMLFTGCSKNECSCLLEKH